jgi:hypothetical protein
LLSSARTAGTTDRIQFKLDVNGYVKVSDEGKVKRLPMHVVGNTQYEERLLESPSPGAPATRSVRHYRAAHAEIQVGSDRSTFVLSKDHSLLVASIDDGRATLFSPREPLTADELDVTDLPANSLALEWLLPDRPVGVGDSWKHSDRVIALLFNLDRVNQNTLESRLSSVEGGTARLDLTGKVVGAEHGLVTTREVKARYRFDIKERRLTWLGLALREERAGGPTEHGLEVTGQFQVIVEPAIISEHLADAAIQGLPLAPSEDLLAIRCRAPDQSWQLTHDRRWQVTRQKGDAATLRMAEQGDLLMQCRIFVTTQVPETDRKLSLADFQADVRRVLDKSYQQPVEAGESVTASGNRVYRVVVEGTPQDQEGKQLDIPCYFVYYLISNDRGQRAVLAFDYKRQDAQRVGHADERLARSFQFLDRTPSGKSDEVGDRKVRGDSGKR